MNEAVEWATCPKCGAEAGQRCRTLSTRRITDTHQARHDAYYDIRMAALREQYQRMVIRP